MNRGNLVIYNKTKGDQLTDRKRHIKRTFFKEYRKNNLTSLVGKKYNESSMTVKRQIYLPPS